MADDAGLDHSAGGFRRPAAALAGGYVLLAVAACAWRTGGIVGVTVAHVVLNGVNLRRLCGRR